MRIVTRLALFLLLIGAGLQETRSQEQYVVGDGVSSSHRANDALYSHRLDILLQDTSLASLQQDSLLSKKPWKPFNTVTIAVQVPAGVAFGAAAGLAVGYLLFPRNSNLNDLGDEVLAGIAAVAAAGVGVPSGVYFAGNWMGGNGSFSATLTWSGYGALGGIVLGSLTRSGVVGGVVYLAGTIVGYHLSASQATSEQSSPPTIFEVQTDRSLASSLPPVPGRELVHLSIAF